MKRFLLPSALLLSSLALAATQTATYFLNVNGQPSSLGAATINGVTYVPLETLRQLGISVSISGKTITLGSSKTATSAGGTNQRASLEGCMGETLFNGVWRFTVKKLEPIGPAVGLGPGWGVTVELKNGTQTKTQLHDTGLESIDLVQPDGNTLSFEQHDAEEKFIFKELIQGAGNTYQLKFHAPDTNTLASSVPRPAKLIVQLDPKRLTAGYLKAGKVAYSTPTPSFRVNLTCQK